MVTGNCACKANFQIFAGPFSFIQSTITAVLPTCPHKASSSSPVIYTLTEWSTTEHHDRDSHYSQRFLSHLGWDSWNENINFKMCWHFPSNTIFDICFFLSFDICHRTTGGKNEFEAEMEIFFFVIRVFFWHKNK